MALREKVKQIAAAVDAEVAELNERTPNHVAKDKDGNETVTEFFATEVQVRKLVRKAVDADANTILDEVAEVVLADLQNKKF